MNKNNKQMLENVINEIKEVQTKLKEYCDKWTNNESFEESIETYCFPNNVTQYDIITLDGNRYIINSLSRNYDYDIDFNKVIYVHKFNGYANANKNNCWDSKRGFYNAYDNWDYYISRYDRYNITNIIGVDKD